MSNERHLLVRAWITEYEAGATIKQVAAGSGLSRETIRKALVAAGVEMRTVHVGPGTEKRCTVCGEVKPISEFPRKAGKVHVRGQCNRCRVAKMSLRQQQRRRTDPEWRDRKNAAQREARRKRPAPARDRTPGTPDWARMQLQHAVRMGRIHKPDACERCGEMQPRERLHGHHWHGDYANRPLEVQWLCTLCHGEAHRIHKLTPERHVRPEEMKAA